MRRLHLVPFILLVAWLAAAAIPATAVAGTVKVTTSIGDAIAAASPGDTIVVPPGTYHEGDLLVTQDNLTIRGSKAAVLDASGHDTGIRVGAGSITGDPPVCPPLSVDNFTLRGMTIQNADDTGLRMFGVDGFHVTGGSYLDNAEYGVFPRCSRDGLDPPQLGRRRRGRHRLRGRRRQRHRGQQQPQPRA